MFVDLVGSGPATLITGASVAHRPKRRFCGVPTQAWGEDPAEGFGEEGRGTLAFGRPCGFCSQEGLGVADAGPS